MRSIIVLTGCEIKGGACGIIPASLLGIASPLCMYGTIPIAASFSHHGMRDDLFIFCTDRRHFLTLRVLPQGKPRHRSEFTDAFPEKSRTEYKGDRTVFLSRGSAVRIVSEICVSGTIPLLQQWLVSGMSLTSGKFPKKCFVLLFKMSFESFWPF